MEKETFEVLSNFSRQNSLQKKSQVFHCQI